MKVLRSPDPNRPSAAAYAYRQRLTYVYIGSGSKNWGDQKGTSGLPVTPRMPSRIFEGRRFSISKRPEVGQFDSTADIRCGRFGGRFASGFLPSRARPEVECQSASPKSLNPVLWWRPFKGAEQGILSRPNKAQSYPGDSTPKSIECLTANYELVFVIVAAGLLVFLPSWRDHCATAN